jgi:hypothetical protein
MKDGYFLDAKIRDGNAKFHKQQSKSTGLELKD